MPKVKHFEPHNDGQRALVEAVDRKSVAFALGPAGTGKTHAAIAIGASLVLQKWARRLIVCRPARSAGRSSGLLPGTLEEKLAPLLQPIYDILSKLGKPGEVPGWVEICSFEYMRGRTFDDAIIVVDEVQNATFDELEMVLTRLGKGSKMILCGDPAQSDLRGADAGALPLLMKLLAGDKEFPVVHFSETDNLRHPVVAKLVKIFATFHAEEHTQRELRAPQDDHDPRPPDPVHQL